ncbi:Metallothiol transferase FosB [Paraliobacillus sp. PM-2]|uniref:SMU1112c/YaeR family gloxylase I-like metalloprotein n=1 Tax=Paraliobacillus sp. PM-2 TaxID=1462524 RepID=UPI00061C2216|nr:VOC family protein [Paraliobacillus sp. PM-2]CQR46377.1 Metallothiol transferase FosB [Paraliobacillus sp. PM-2]
MFESIHHVAIICSDYEKSKAFYVDILGLQVIQEVYREARASYKLDLALGNTYVIELFSFPDSPRRLSYPEAQGLRHLAFSVRDLNYVVETLTEKGIEVEPIRIDPCTEARFTFFQDPDGLPIEIVEK